MQSKSIIPNACPPDHPLSRGTGMWGVRLCASLKLSGGGAAVPCSHKREKEKEKERYVCVYIYIYMYGWGS